MTKNWKKITAENFFYFFLSKTAIYLFLGLHKVCPSYRRSLHFSKEAIQHFKTRTFTNYCLLLWVIFALLDPDPDSEYGSGSRDPIEYGSNTDPDPQPCQRSASFWAALGIREILVKIRILGSVPLTNGSGCRSGMPKTYGSYRSGSGCGSGTLVKSHKEVTNHKRSRFFLLFLLDDGMIWSRIPTGDQIRMLTVRPKNIRIRIPNTGTHFWYGGIPYIIGNYPNMSVTRTVRTGTGTVPMIGPKATNSLGRASTVRHFLEWRKRKKRTTHLPCSEQIYPAQNEIIFQTLTRKKLRQLYLRLPQLWACCLDAWAGGQAAPPRWRSWGWAQSSPWSRRGRRTGRASYGDSSGCASEPTHKYTHKVHEKFIYCDLCVEQCCGSGFNWFVFGFG